MSLGVAHQQWHILCRHSTTLSFHCSFLCHTPTPPLFIFREYPFDTVLPETCAFLAIETAIFYQSQTLGDAINLIKM